MTARGWLSTWSGLSSHAKLADTMPQVTVPTLLVHPTADTEIRVWQAKEIVDDAGAADVTYVEMKGAPHYLEGHRPEAMAHRRRLAGQALPLTRDPPSHEPTVHTSVRWLIAAVGRGWVMSDGSGSRTFGSPLSAA